MIQIESLRKSWPGFTLAVERLEIRDGEYFVVLGPSGAGKTVLLSCLGGILQPDRGRIWLGDRDVTALPPERRGIGWVSQFSTLFPHLTVKRNIAFGRRYSKVGREEFERRVARLVDLLELRPLLDRLPAQLSGGEVQRATLARALALEPRVLLLDEPLRGLDPTTQERLRDELARIHRALGTTTLHITHDHVEARALADRIAVLRAGRIEQVGEADEVFERPATCFVARFTGAENLFALAGGHRNVADDAALVIDRSGLPPLFAAGDSTHIAIRPEHVEIRAGESEPTAPCGDSLHFRGTIEALARHGGWLRIAVRCGEMRWVALVHPREVGRLRLEAGRDIGLSISAEHVCPIRDAAHVAQRAMSGSHSSARRSAIVR